MPYISGSIASALDFVCSKPSWSCVCILQYTFSSVSLPWCSLTSKIWVQPWLSLLAHDLHCWPSHGVLTFEIVYRIQICPVLFPDHCHLGPESLTFFFFFRTNSNYHWFKKSKSVEKSRNEKKLDSFCPLANRFSFPDANNNCVFCNFCIL